MHDPTLPEDAARSRFVFPPLTNYTPGDMGRRSQVATQLLFQFSQVYGRGMPLQPPTPLATGAPPYLHVAVDNTGEGA